MSWANRTCPKTLEWRNWQTHETQNLALVTQHGGSTPPSSINIPLTLVHVGRALQGGFARAGVSWFRRPARRGAPARDRLHRANPHERWTFRYAAFWCGVLRRPLARLKISRWLPSMGAQLPPPAPSLRRSYARQPASASIATVRLVSVLVSVDSFVRRWTASRLMGGGTAVLSFGTASGEQVVATVSVTAAVAKSILYLKAAPIATPRALSREHADARGA